MFTLGYSFRPWTDPKAIADGDAIRDYIRDTAREYGVDRQIRFHHRVVARRLVLRRRPLDGHAPAAPTPARPCELTCSFLYGCTGYYRYDEGYTPHFAGLERFAGRIVHPQHWPEDLDDTGKRVVVIGSGATAVTLVPAMAERGRARDHAAALAELRRWRCRARPAGRRAAPPAARDGRLPDRPVEERAAVDRRSSSSAGARPALMRRLLRTAAARQLPAGYDVDTHFTPAYDPWDQRLCLVPDGDLFAAIRAGRASVATGRSTPSPRRAAARLRARS